MASAVSPEQHRALAVELFNRAWELMALADRGPAEDDRLLHTAHASRHHWGEVGAPENLARGEWQCSRVYVVLGRAEPALHHARRCLELCEEHGLADWDLAYAHEALARAHALAGDADAAAGHRELAGSIRIADPEDREHLLEDLATLPA
ncbi:MAG: hypothetical protein QOE36_2452 [Gaiellaceae bacterium]|jgi:hypothetical protein|nr:hypothetical protein [Gaiellaceae bacterium]